MSENNGQIAILAEKLNQASLRSTLNPEKIERLSLEIIPTDHAKAIFDNCLRVAFFPYGSKPPASKQEFTQVAAQMSKTLQEFSAHVASHKIKTTLTAKEILAQYNANAIFYSFGSVKVKNNIADDMQKIKWLIQNSATQEMRNGYEQINDVAKKLAQAVNDAANTLQNNFITLATALISCNF